MSEQIYKLQPNRTLALRGFDALGSSAAIHSATANSFVVSGNFRDAADFAVLILWDADNFYEHPRLKYLPDFNFGGATLTFEVAYDAGLQPLDSPQYNWIDWATLDCALADETPDDDTQPTAATTTAPAMPGNTATARVTIWDHCTLVSGNFTPASATFHLASSSSPQPYDRVTLWYQDFSYDYIVPPNTVEYQFFDGGGASNPSITVNGRFYQDTTLNPATQSSAQQVVTLINLINNRNGGDPDVTASAGSVSNAVLLTVKSGQGGPAIPVSASDGNASVTLKGNVSLSDVAATLANEINGSNWWGALPELPLFALRAVAGPDSVTVSTGRYGTVNTAGAAVTWASGAKFTGLPAGGTIMIAGATYPILAVNSPTQLTLGQSAGSLTGANYVADRGGVDGNLITMYSTSKDATSTSTLRCKEAAVPLTGGNSQVTWQCSLDFTALGIDKLRQCWLTFAPPLANGAAYAGSEWSATFTGWTLTGDPNVTKLQVAGPNSVRIEDTSSACTYSGTWASSTPATGFFSEGLARVTDTLNDSVTVTYSCGQTHDLYLGTSLYKDRGIAAISLDGDPQTQLNCELMVEPEVNTRRIVRSAVGAGTHSVTLKLVGAGYFYFDFIEAAVTSDVPDALTGAMQIADGTVSPALDYSTDHSYKLPPARILWIMDQLGLTGPVNQYLGIFWYNQRNNSTAVFPAISVTFAGAWNENDILTLSISGAALNKSVIAEDTNSTIAAHFEYWINQGFVGIWASANGPVLTITARSPTYDTFTVSPSTYRYTTGSISASAGTIALSRSDGSLSAASLGIWTVDPTQSPALNRGARDWLADLYYECKSRGREIVTAGSMELVNPPAGFAALFPDGTPVSTSEQLDGLFSTQCAPGATLLAYQQSVFDCVTDLQNAAGLTPNVQFGEYVWWFFSKIKGSLAVGYASFTSPISIGTAAAHGLGTGDFVIIAGVGGNTAANGKWTVTVTDSTHFTLNGSSGNGTYTGGGTLTGGGMAYYDAGTVAAARAQLGRALYNFTGPNDDPTVNGGADALFLRNRLRDHVAALSAHIKSRYPAAQCEVLYPFDVNYPTVQGGVGGALNHYVNFPAEWGARTTAGFDRLKVEALSFGGGSRNLDLAREAVQFAFSLSWPTAALRYLVPVFVQCGTWQKELAMALAMNYPVVNMWAFDQVNIFGLNVIAASNQARSGSFAKN